MGTNERERMFHQGDGHDNREIVSTENQLHYVFEPAQKEAEMLGMRIHLSSQVLNTPESDSQPLTGLLISYSGTPEDVTAFEITAQRYWEVMRERRANSLLRDPKEIQQRRISGFEPMIAEQKNARWVRAEHFIRRNRNGY